MEKIRQPSCKACEGTGKIQVPFGNPVEYQPEPCDNCFEPNKELTVRFEFRNINDIATKMQDIMAELYNLGDKIHLGENGDGLTGFNWEIEEYGNK